MGTRFNKTAAASVEGVITADATALTQVRGVGPNEAARIRELVTSVDRDHAQRQTAFRVRTGITYHPRRSADRLTDEVLQRMRERGTWYVPTIVVSQPTVMEFFKKIGSPDWYLARVESVGKAHWRTLQSAIKRGVKIALGTDQFPYEPNDGTTATVREAQYYVEAGRTPLNAPRAATIEPATMLGAADRLGSVERGKLADQVITHADPSKDIKALRSIKLVMKGGVVYRNDLPE